VSNVYLDLETTGLDPHQHHVWEIGLITDDGEYNWILELKEAELDTATPMALAVGHYYERSYQAYRNWSRRISNTPKDRFVIDGEEEIEKQAYISVEDRKPLAKLIVRLIGTAHLVGAVPSFDERFLGDFLRDYGLPPAWHYHLVDVEALAAGKLGRQPPWDSKNLYREVGIEPTAFDEHTALGDARMAKAVYEQVFDLPPSYHYALLSEEKGEVPVSH
jgi:DNA polymerase III epsilon subunit-like protein